MSAPPAGTPVGLEVPARDVARGKPKLNERNEILTHVLSPGSAFYSAVFNWTFAPSTWGIPAHKLLTFEVPGGVFPIGGALRLADDLAATGMGTTKLYLYVDDITAAMQVRCSFYLKGCMNLY